MSKRFLKKIIAQSPEDLRIISALCSNSKIKQSEIKFLKKNKVFLIPLERNLREKFNKNNKINSIIKFEFVDSSKSKNINQKNNENILQLLTIELFKSEKNFEIVIFFLNNAAITLSAEVLEVTLEDLNT
tara:strand:+ start:1066 stop:1455 length:390 start_codon:yes stop_codon:yes gene_type:complete